MKDEKGILSLLGLCLRGRNLAVGDGAADAAAMHRARLLLLSADASPNTCRRARHLSSLGQCLLETLPFTRAEVGGALGRGSAALCAVTDTGLAAALMQRLEGAYPGRYTQSLERLEIKRRRAAERRSRGPRPAPAPRQRPPALPERSPRQTAGPSGKGRGPCRPGAAPPPKGPQALPRPPRGQRPGPVPGKGAAGRGAPPPTPIPPAGPDGTHTAAR